MKLKIGGLKIVHFLVVPLGTNLKRYPLLQEPFILKVLENNRVLRGKTRFYEKHTIVRVLSGFCTGFVWFLYGFSKVKPGVRLENPVFGKPQAQNQVFRSHPLFLKVLGVEGTLNGDPQWFFLNYTPVLRSLRTQAELKTRPRLRPDLPR